MCSECGHRFTTRERIEESAPVVLKRDGKREPFDRAKLLRGLEIACRKRPVSPDALEAIVSAIEQWANTRGDREVTSDEVGERAMHHLHELDQVAYVRFVSVYRSFETIEEFAALLAEMEKAERVDNAGQRELFAELEAAAGSDAAVTAGPLAMAGPRGRGVAPAVATEPELGSNLVSTAVSLHGPRDGKGA
jgi:transcriptional repressor NrdR